MKNYIGAAVMPDAERSKDEYIGSVYGTAALGYITMIRTLDAIDALEERHADILRVRKVKGLMNDVCHSLDMMRVNINLSLARKGDAAWMFDFGNAAYERVQTHIDRLRTAVANALGKHPKVDDPNCYADLIVAQSLASEATSYTRRRTELFRGCTVCDHENRRWSVAQILGSMSCATVDFKLRKICDRLIAPLIEDDTDLLADPSVRIGCKAVVNAMGNVSTWAYARDKADRLNGVKKTVDCVKTEDGRQ